MPDGHDIKLWTRSKSPPQIEGHAVRTPLLPFEPEKLDFSKPIFLCLGGIETTSPRHANGFAKRIIGLAGGESIFEHGAQVITAEYAPVASLAAAMNPDINIGAQQLDGLGNRIKHFTEDVSPSHPIQVELPPKGKKCAEYLVNTIFARKDIIPDLRGLSGDARECALERSREALHKVNIVSYSFGSYITPFLHEEMRRLMNERGFTEREGIDARHEMQVVSFGDVGMWYRNTQDMTKLHNEERTPWDFTSVHVVSIDDKAVQKFAGITPDEIVEEANRDRLMTFGNGIEENMALVISRLPHEVTHVVDGKLRTHRRHETGHAVPDYTGTSQEHPDAGSAPYFSVSGGQWFIPSVLATALHNCLESSLSPHYRGNVLCMLLPQEKNDDFRRDLSKITHDYQMVLPGNPGYDSYHRRIVDLMENRIYADRLPLTRRGSWAAMLDEGCREFGEEPLYR